VAHTWRTIGNCSGGFLCSNPWSNHTSKAVSCSVKKGLGWIKRKACCLDTLNFYALDGQKVIIWKINKEIQSSKSSLQLWRKKFHAILLEHSITMEHTWNSAFGSSTRDGSWERQISAAISHASLHWTLVKQW
jgi:hypothetical protein